METRQYLLIDLDALLDTRLGCLIQHRVAEAAEIDMAAYRGRFNDDLWTLCRNVTEDDYRQWWADRDETTLQCSFATPMMMRLKAMTYELVAKKASHAYLKEIKVFVNIYPYRLSDQIKAEYQSAIKEVVHRGVGVEMVSLPPEQLSPQSLMSHYNYYALYDFDRWLTCQHEVLGENPIPAFPMNAPALFANALPDQTDIEKLGLFQTEEAFAQWEFYFGAHLSLGFLPAVEYSQLL